MMITSTPMIVPISPLFTMPSFRFPNQRLGGVRAVVRLAFKSYLSLQRKVGARNGL